jgi:hypothetical protein
MNDATRPVLAVIPWVLAPFTGRNNLLIILLTC